MAQTLADMLPYPSAKLKVKKKKEPHLVQFKHPSKCSQAAPVLHPPTVCVLTKQLHGSEQPVPHLMQELRKQLSMSTK